MFWYDASNTDQQETEWTSIAISKFDVMEFQEQVYADAIFESFE